MELVLNLVWLLLTVPAYWVWWQRSRESGSLRSVVTLGCVLFLLFPIISATDDLHAMRPEMEELSPTKRSLKQAGSVKISTQSHTGIPPASLAAFITTSPDSICERVATGPVSKSPSAVLIVRSGRAPPTFLLA